MDFIVGFGDWKIYKYDRYEIAPTNCIVCNKDVPNFHIKTSQWEHFGKPTQFDICKNCLHQIGCLSDEVK